MAEHNGYHTTIYLVLSVFTSRPTSLLTSDRASLFFVKVCLFLSNIYIISIDQDQIVFHVPDSIF